MVLHPKNLWITLSRDSEGRLTYPVVWVGELLRAVVEGFKVKGFLLVKGDHFGKRGSMILTEDLTLPVIKMQ